MKHFVYNEINIYLGEDKHENWNLIETSRPNDIFVHLNSFPSGHVKIEMDIFDIEIVVYAGNICRQYSKYKHLKDLKICYCRYDNILKGDKTGEVVFKSNRKVKKIKLD